MLTTFSLVLLLITAGYGLRKFGIVREEAAQDLNQIVFNLTLPLLIFIALHRLDFSWSLLALPLAAWWNIALGLGLGLLLSRLLKLEPHKAGAFLLVLVFGNTTFWGYPMVRGFWGDAYLPYAIFYDLLGGALAANTLGILVASVSGAGGFNFTYVARRLLFYPPIWALTLGLLLHPLALPPVVEAVLFPIGQLTTPLIMIAVGMSLRFRHWAHEWRLISLATVLRLLLIPLLLWGSLRFFNMPLPIRQTAVMQSAMPTMFLAYSFATTYELDDILAVNGILVTTLTSFFTLFLWHFLLR